MGTQANILNRQPVNLSEITDAQARQWESRGRILLFCLAIGADADRAAIHQAHQYPYLTIEDRWEAMGHLLRRELVKMLGLPAPLAGRHLAVMAEYEYAALADRLSDKARQLLALLDAGKVAA